MYIVKIWIAVTVIGSVWGWAGSFYLSLFKEKSRKGYRITYDVTMGGADGMQKMQMVYYKKGKNMRIDMREGGFESRMYSIASKSYNCSKTGSGWQCMEGMIDASLFDTFSSIPTNEKEVSKVRTRNVAGKEARCYRPKFTGAQGMNMEFCISKDGVPLYIEQGDKDVSFVMKAISYTSDVSSNDFKLPAKPISMQNMMDMMRQMQGAFPAGGM